MKIIKLKIILITIFLFFYSNNFAQQSSCNCLENYLYFTNSITKNYSGYSYKIKGKEATLAKLTDSLKVEAGKIGNKNCLPILDKWVSFFSDPHLSVYFSKNEDLTPEITESVKRNTKIINITKTEIKKYLIGNNKLDSIEGLWQNLSGTSNFIILKENMKPSGKKQRFVAFITLTNNKLWEKGQLKAEFTKEGDSYKTIYYDGNHLPLYVDSKISSSKNINKTELVLEIGELFTLYKKKSLFDTSTTILHNNQTQKKPIEISYLNSKTVLITIKSFDEKYKSYIDSLIKIHEPKLSRTPNFIVDIRNNAGGSVESYKELFPFLYTNPILKPHFAILSSEGNIKLVKSMINDKMTKEQKKEWEDAVVSMEKNIGGLYREEKRDTIKLNKVFEYPSKIAILINGSSASASEYFLLDARQSKKVKIFGAPTNGAIAFLEYIDENYCPCKAYKFVYPVAINEEILKLGGDRATIKPDVSIPKNVKDWIKFVQDSFDKW